MSVPLRDSPFYMRMLADWIDKKYPNDPTPQAQDDLRYWADEIERLFTDKHRYQREEMT
jgi:hypothetical protein